MVNEVYIMTATSFDSISGGIGFDPRQISQTMQPKANGKTAEDEKIEVLQVESASTRQISIEKPPMDVRLYQIHQAAEAGILRPLWLEAINNHPDMPRMNDLINRNTKNTDGKSEYSADDAERTDISTQAADDAERAARSARMADDAARADRSARAADDAERAAREAENSAAVSD